MLEKVSACELQPRGHGIDCEMRPSATRSLDGTGLVSPQEIPGRVALAACLYDVAFQGVSSCNAQGDHVVINNVKCETGGAASCPWIQRRLGKSPSESQPDRQRLARQMKSAAGRRESCLGESESHPKQLIPPYS
jgi:hypothetical protein